MAQYSNCVYRILWSQQITTKCESCYNYFSFSKRNSHETLVISFQNFPNCLHCNGLRGSKHQLFTKQNWAWPYFTWFRNNIKSLATGLTIKIGSWAISGIYNYDFYLENGWLIRSRQKFTMSKDEFKRRYWFFVARACTYCFLFKLGLYFALFKMVRWYVLLLISRTEPFLPSISPMLKNESD